MMHLEEMGDDTVEDIHRKQDYCNRLVQSDDYLFGRLLLAILICIDEVISSVWRDGGSTP